MPGIFISYRRGDSPGTAGRLYDRLAPGFGKENVFFDVDGIEPGVDFVTVIEEKVSSCDVLVALVGPDWDAKRLANPDDFVRLEIGAALRRNIRVIPVLLDGAGMPAATELPEPLVGLARRQALGLSHLHFDRDAEGLIRSIEKVSTGWTRPTPPVPADLREKKRANESGWYRKRLIWAAAVVVVASLAAYAILRQPRIVAPHVSDGEALVEKKLACSGRCVTGRDGLNYIWIEPGTFMMGCSPGDSDCDDQFEQRHKVTLTQGFWMGQTEVTQAAWSRVMKTEPSEFKGLALPVERVSWEKADDYCKKIGGRLPTEAEWEYAARGGAKDSRYGSLLDIAWIADNSGVKPMDATGDWQRDQGRYLEKLKANHNRSHAVGEKQPNAYGLHDMLGNVHEWHADWYAPYGKEPVTDPRGPDIGKFRSVRGGAWSVPRWYSRASTRVRMVSLDLQDSDLGFRCAADRLQ